MGKTTQLRRRLILQSQISSNKDDIAPEQLIDGPTTIETTSKRIAAIIKGPSAFYVNLLNNTFDAVKFLPQKWVDIDTQIVGEACRILITDSGPGIAPRSS